MTIIEKLDADKKATAGLVFMSYGTSGPNKVAESLRQRERYAAALRAVAAGHSQELGGTPTGDFADVCGGCPSYWPCPTITAIAEALDG